MNKIIKKYLSRAKTLFPIMGADERNYLRKLEMNIENSFSDNKYCIEDLYKEFGSPEEIVNLYYINSNTSDIIKRIRISKYIKLFIFSLIICILSLTILRLSILHEGHQVFMREEIVSEQSIIE